MGFGPQTDSCAGSIHDTMDVDDHVCILRRALEKITKFNEFIRSLTSDRGVCCMQLAWLSTLEV